MLGPHVCFKWMFGFEAREMAGAGRGGGRGELELGEWNGCGRSGGGVRNVGGMRTDFTAEWSLKILCLAKVKG